MDHSYDSEKLEKASDLPSEDRIVVPPPEVFESSENGQPVVFPKEFNKNYLQSLDRRYLVILSLIVVFELTLIFYFLYNFPIGKNEDEYVTKLQDKYAELFLKEFVEEDTPQEITQNELLLYATEYVHDIVDEAFGTGESRVPEARPGAGTAETRAPTREASQAKRTRSRAAREQAKEALSEEVSRTGLLGIIASGKNIISYQPVEDVLAYSEAHANNLEDVLSQVGSLKVSRAGSDYYGAPIGNGLEDGAGADRVTIAKREARGARLTGTGVSPKDIVTSLAQVTHKEVQRNRSYEVVQAVSSLPGLPALPKRRKGTREPHKMREIVIAHKAAIEDCYRQSLKYHPGVKGKVTVRFTISYTGHVVEADIISASMTMTGLNECILRKILNWNDFGEVDPSVGDMTFRQTYVFGY